MFDVAATAREAADKAVGAYLDLHGIAAHLHLNPRTIQRLTAAGRLPHVRIGRNVRYPVAIIDAQFAAEAVAVVRTAEPPVGDQPRRARRRGRIVQPSGVA